MKRLLLAGLLALVAAPVFAQVKISELGTSGPLTGAEELPIVQDGSTFKTTTADIAALGAVIQTGTFTITWSNGCTTQPTQDFAYTKIGNLVFVQFVTGVSCTSNSAAWTTATGQWPAAIRPTTTETSTTAFAVIDNGTNGNFPGCLRITPAGAVNAARTTSGGQWCGNSWTSSGTKAISINPGVYIGSNTIMYTIY